MAGSLHRCLAALHAAESTCSAASAIDLEVSKPRRPFKVVQVATHNVLRVPSKEEQAALADTAKLKDVLIALRSVITPDKTDSLAGMEAEAEGLLGKVAELKAQAAEVANAGFVKDRVEDATMEQQQDAEAAEQALREAEAALEGKEGELLSLEENLSKIAGKKRARTEEAAAAEAAREGTPEDLEMACVSYQVAEAEAEGAAAVAQQQLAQARARREAVEKEVERAREAAAGLAAVAAEGLSRLEREDAEYKQLGARASEARAGIAEAEAAGRVAEMQVGELRGGVAVLASGMAAQGVPAAVALHLLAQAHGTLPLKELKEALAAAIEAQAGSRGTTPVSQQVLETVYSLVSASLVSIDRSSAQQTVTVCI